MKYFVAFYLIVMSEIRRIKKYDFNGEKFSSLRRFSPIANQNQFAELVHNSTSDKLVLRVPPNEVRLGLLLTSNYCNVYLFTPKK